MEDVAASISRNGICLKVSSIGRLFGTKSASVDFNVNLRLRVS